MRSNPIDLRQTQLASANSPRSDKSSDTCRYASGYRKYHRTAIRMTSPGYWRPLNGSVGVIGIGLLTLSERRQKFATEPARPTNQNADRRRRTERCTAEPIELLQPSGTRNQVPVQAMLRVNLRMM